MSFNKAKAIKTASKYVQQGKYQSAIEEYRQIALAEPSDVTTLNTLGDLYVKVGQTSEAIHSFLHIAEHYRLSGFYLKAIAMLKKISKLDPDNIDVALKLASLYAQQKLIVDARHQYLNVAERYIREGQSREALHIYQKIANLDPENTAIQIKLAEAYLRENETEQAYESFLVAAGELRRQSKEAEALQTYLRAIKANSKGQAALSSIVNIYLQRNEHKEAIELLESLMAENPDDPEILTLLSRVYQTTGNLPAAETAIEKMLTVAPTRYQYAVDLGLTFVRREDIPGAVRLFDRVAPILNEYREEEKAANLLREILAVETQHLGALTRLVSIYERTHEEHLLIETLNNIVYVATKQGDQPAVINALKQLVQLEPDEMQHRRRLRELEGPGPEPVEESESYSFSYDNGSEPSEDHNQWGGQNNFGGSFDSLEAENPQVAYAFHEPQEAPTVVPVPTNGASEEWGHWTASAIEGQPQENFSVNYGNSFEPEGKAESFSTDAESNYAEMIGTTASGSSVNVSLNDELESVDFYLSQGMLDVARYTLESVAAQHPGHPDIAEKFAQLNTAENHSAQNFLSVENPPEPQESTPEPFQAVSFESSEPAFQPPSNEPATGFWGSQSYDLAPGNVVNEGFQFEVLDEMQEEADIILTPPPAPVFKQEPAPPPPALEPPLPAVPPKAAVVESKAAPTPAASMDLFDGEEMADLLDFLDEFKNETEQSKSGEDFETHYNLGLAYKEMDMFDEAIEEFQQAFKSIMNDVRHPNYVPCCNMLGFCFTQKGLPRLALMWLKRALETPGLSDDTYQALRYDLADAYAATGEFQNAYDIFAEVYALDVQYRNVKTRLQEVSSQLSR